MFFPEIVKKLKDNDPQLRVVNLESHSLSPENVQPMAEALNKNSHLTLLNLKNNNLRDEGASLLARALTGNRFLTSLDLRNNSITPSGARELAKMMKTNYAITSLQLGEVAKEKLNLGTYRGVEDNRFNCKQEMQIISKYMESNLSLAKCVSRQTRVLRFSKRGLNTIPSNLLLRGIQKMDLSGNAITTVPAAIAQCQRLEVLFLFSNKLTTLPPEIGFLKRLRILNLSGNELTGLPITFGLLASLVKLDITNNKIATIPKILGSLPNLAELEVKGNPLTTVPKEIIDANGVLPYIQNLCMSGTERCYRSKLMFVGNGNVGKTTLLSAIKKHAEETTKKKKKFMGSLVETVEFAEERRPNDRNIATDGIDISTWKLKQQADDPSATSRVALPEGKELSLYAWDFAGQEVYYSTHQYFLSHRALYLVIFNLLDDINTNRIQYWLHAIAVRAQRAPVILVGTHADDPRCTEAHIKSYFKDLALLFKTLSLNNGNRNWYDNILFKCTVSCTTGQGIAELKEKIVEITLKQSHMGEEIPLNYFAVEEKVTILKTAKNKPTLSWREFSRMAVDCKVPQPDVIHVATFLHHLGSIIYFNDKQSGLDKLVVLDSQWLTRVLATVVTMKANYVRNGLLMHSDLPQIWKPPAFPQQLHRLLLVLLAKLELAYHLPVEPACSFIPCLCEAPRPSAVEMVKLLGVDTPQFLGRVYAYNFLPLGFFPKLVVRLLNSGWSSTTYWQNGIILCRNAERVLLTLRQDLNQAGDDRLSLLVFGQDRVRCLINLSDSLETLIGDWLEAQFNVFIPCNHCPFGDEDPHMFPLDDVQLTIAEGGTSLRCAKEDIDINLDDIAPDSTMAAFPGLKIPYEAITDLKEIGHGSFGEVFKGVYQGKVYAIKKLQLDKKKIEQAKRQRSTAGARCLTTLPNDQPEKSVPAAMRLFSTPESDARMNSSTASTQGGGSASQIATNPLRVLSEFRREVWVMSGLQHPNLAGLTGITVAPFSMLMDYMELGCLHEWLRLKQTAATISWSNRIKIASDIARGMLFLHSLTPPTIHRDLKSPNVLLKRETDGTIVARVADFGLARSMELVGELTGNQVENPIWLAPEVIRKQPYNTAADVYSFGVIMYELMTLKDFFGDERFFSRIEARVLKGERPPVPEGPDVPKDYVSLLTSCWADDAHERPSFLDVNLQLLKLRSAHGLAVDKAELAMLTERAEQLKASMASNKENGEDGASENLTSEIINPTGSLIGRSVSCDIQSCDSSSDDSALSSRTSETGRTASSVGDVSPRKTRKKKTKDLPKSSPELERKNGSETSDDKKGNGSEAVDAATASNWRKAEPAGVESKDKERKKGKKEKGKGKGKEKDKKEKVKKGKDKDKDKEGTKKKVNAKDKPKKEKKTSKAKKE